MPEKVKTVLIGGFIIIACLSILGVLLFLRPSVGDGKKKLFVCFTSIEKIQLGTRVTFAGKPVGEVVAIREIYDARSQPTGRYGHICFYELELAIDSKTVVYDTDEIALHTTGLMGEKTIAIIPKSVPKGTPSYPVTDQIMYGKSSDAVEDTLNQIAQLSSKASGVIDQIHTILVEDKEPLHEAIVNIMNITESLASKRGDIAVIIDNLHHMTDRLAVFSDSMNPAGSLGKFLQDDTAYLQLVQLMSKANVMMDDVNNYGVLFHLDKGWQRERMRRMNLLAKLSTAKEFSCYFEDEMGQINISLARIAKALAKAQKARACYGVVHDKDFNSQYSELMGRLQDVEETLEVYRQQLIECEKVQTCGRPRR